MQSTYLIISAPNSDALQKASVQLQSDIDNGYTVGQVFFYSDAVVLGALDDYPEPALALIDVAETHDIALHLCSAGFQKRDCRLSVIAEQDFAFKGLGQFMAETHHADAIRVF